MNAMPFDTLKLAKRLEAAGLSAQTAAGTAEALAEAMAGAELATKSDIENLRAETKSEIRAGRAEVKSEIELLRRDITIRFGSMLIVAVSVILAALRYLPPPHS